MNLRTNVPLHAWTIEPPDENVRAALQRLSRADDVRRIAVMPDVHLAGEVCVGTVLATNTLAYPGAVGGDIGCGMAAIAFDCSGADLDRPDIAPHVLADLVTAVPIERHRRANQRSERLEILANESLSSSALEKLRVRDGVLQFATLGRGNHFVELQRDDDDRLWLMVHTGSRGMGQAVHTHHLARATRGRGGLYFLDTSTEAGRAYLHDMSWARRYAHQSRLAMLDAVAGVVRRRMNASVDHSTFVACDHNHLRVESHDGTPTLVHRKGATPAGANEPGLIPGSMGTMSFHTAGRGCVESLNSSSHGAGRRMTRDHARRHIDVAAFANKMERIWFDRTRLRTLVDESPDAYRDIRAVMRAQRALTRMVRRLTPVMAYKG